MVWIERICTCLSSEYVYTNIVTVTFRFLFCYMSTMRELADNARYSYRGCLPIFIFVAGNEFIACVAALHLYCTAYNNKEL